MTDRVPPADVTAEAGLIGGMIASPKGVDAALDTRLTRADFYNPVHGHIFSAILDLHSRGEAYDVSIVADELRRDNLLDAVGGPDALTALWTASPLSSLAPRYARIVKDMANLRHLIQAAIDVSELAYSLPDDVGSAVIRANAMLASVADEAAADDDLWTDIGAVMAEGLDLDPPTIGHRADGRVNLLYPGRVHTVAGEPETGKSMLSTLIMRQEIEAGHHVMLLDWEDSAKGHIARLTQMGCDEAAVKEFFHYAQRDEKWSDASKAKLRRDLALWQPSLVVVDAMTPALAVEGADDNSGTDVARFYSDVIRVCRNAGAAVLIIDHVAKVDAGGWAIGSGYKKGGIDGISYMMKKVDPMGRGLLGRAQLRIAKDRHGFVRQYALDGVLLGMFVVDGRTPGVIDASLQAPPNGATGTANMDGSKRYPALMAMMSAVLERAGADGLSSASWRACVKGGTSEKQAAVKALIDEGYVRKAKRSGSNTVSMVSISLFREHSDIEVDAGVLDDLGEF